MAGLATQGSLARSRLETVSEEESTALDTLLDANGLTRDNLLSGKEEIRHLEMFLHYYPKMLGLNFFPGLRTLCLVNQEITEIEGLEDCLQLEKLWLSENSISTLQGLSHLVKLSELYLGSNKIRKIQGLEALRNLEVLWLCDNYITTVEGLSSLVKLRELHLARNDIANLGPSLSANTALEVLNLSDNLVGDFKELQALVYLPRLTDLSFADPMWGDCPLAGLCNYQTYVLFTLPRLNTLDTLLLADETKALAEATFLKKQMYYNMRIKTLHRHARNVVKAAAEGRKARQASLVPLLLPLEVAQRELQRELEEADAYGGQFALQLVRQSQLQSKLTAVTDSLAAHMRASSASIASFEYGVSGCYGLVEGHVGRMLLELQTAGNVRLEEGRPTDVWYASCVELLQSRFTAADYDVSYGITGVRVLGVARVHNRWLRNRFERQLSTASAAAAGGNSNDSKEIKESASGNAPTSSTGGVAASTGSASAASATAAGGSATAATASAAAGRRAMEYLFFGESPALPGEMDRAIEDGFRSGAELASMGLDAATVLSNSMHLADALRLEAGVESSASGCNGSGTSTTGPSLTTGRLMVVKAYLGRTAQDLTAPISSRSAHRTFWKDGKLQPGSTLEGPRVTRAAHPEVDALYRLPKVGDTRNRLWYVFNHMIVLPEYIVEFQYDTSSTSQLLRNNSTKAGGTPAISPAAMATVAESLEPEMRPLARPLLGWLALAPSFASARSTSAASASTAETAEVAELLALPPPPPTRAKVLVLDPESVAQHVGGAQLETLTLLHLHNCGLKRMDGMPSLPLLTKLVLSFNSLTRMEGLASLASLAHLDLGHNQIQRVEFLKGLTSLTYLNLTSNQLRRLEDVYALRKYVPQLQQLDLSRNPLSEDKAYRSTVLRKLLPSLQLFDQAPIPEVERVMFGVENAGALTQALIKEHGTVGHRLVGGPDSGAFSSGELQVDQITDLVLERKHIRRLQHLTGLVHLRRASFADNEISGLEGLEGCSSLEELCVEDNRISSIVGLVGLTRLTKLQLGQNRVSSIASLATGAPYLRQLSVEDNELGSLAGVEALTSLLELYAGNNKITEQREVQRLRNLPKLIILDLSGNGLCGSSGSSAADDYRLHVIYAVRRLKVLDGISVSAAEQASAKGKYSGRLSSDLLEERLGHRNFDRIRELDVAGLKVRDVGSVFLSKEWEGLQELNLEANTLSDISGLLLLKSLVVLRLSGNRLGLEDSGTFSPRTLLERSPELQRAVCGTEASGNSNSRGKGGGGSNGAEPPVLPAGFEMWPYLQVLHLASNQVSSIVSLQLGTLTSLRTLFLQNNDITRFDGLDGLVNLQELVLDRNRVRYVDPDSFVNLPRLRELRIEENGLRSLGNLHPLAGSLQALHLGSNRISEPSDLDKLLPLTGLVELTLTGNPLTRKQTYRALTISKLPRLQMVDGLAVTFEEREYADNLFNPVPQPNADPAGLVLAAAQAAGGKVALKMTSLDFAGLASTQYAQAFGAGSGNSSVPSIQASTLVLAGASGFGLEGVGFGSSAGGGGDPRVNGMWPPASHMGANMGSGGDKRSVHNLSYGMKGMPGGEPMGLSGGPVAGSGGGMKGGCASPGAMAGSSPIKRQPGTVVARVAGFRGYNT